LRTLLDSGAVEGLDREAAAQNLKGTGVLFDEEDHPDF
jgi:hypothetical protein